MRIAVGMLGTEADAAHHVKRRGAARRPIHLRAVELQRLFQDRDDALARIERAVGVLEDDLDVAAEPGKRPPVGLGDVRSLDDEVARGRRLDHGDDPGEGGLAAAGFADDGERPAGREREAHPVHRLDEERRREGPARQGVVAGEVVRRDDGFAGRRHAGIATAAAGWPSGFPWASG